MTVVWLFARSSSGMSTCFLGLLSKHFSPACDQDVILLIEELRETCYTNGDGLLNHLTYLRLLSLDPQINSPLQFKCAESEIKDSHHGSMMRMHANVDVQCHFRSPVSLEASERLLASLSPNCSETHTSSSQLFLSDDRF